MNVVITCVLMTPSSNVFNYCTFCNKFQKYSNTCCDDMCFDEFFF